ncbi:MAG: hypothetical protein C0602_10930 [Denitrovibrio sp.]|nr:MAG: hypothetical protein C0602_10930 [Denitrovibrio sp.]
MNDKRLVRKFFEENSGKLFAYMLKMAGNRDDAEDCFQDCFIKYTEKYPDKLSMPLLYTVAKSICLDRFRKNRRYEHSEVDSESTSPSPEEALISKDANASLNKAMSMLEKDEKELLALAGPQGLKYSEISEITGLSIANVKVKIHRARQKLKKNLGEMNYA